MNEPEKKEFQSHEIDTHMQRLDIIEETLFKEDVLGFNPVVLSVLDDPNASQQEVENMKVELGCLLFHFGFLMMLVYKNRRQDGDVHSHEDASVSLGTIIEEQFAAAGLRKYLRIAEKAPPV